MRNVTRHRAHPNGRIPALPFIGVLNSIKLNLFEKEGDRGGGGGGGRLLLFAISRVAGRQPTYIGECMGASRAEEVDIAT